MITYRFTYRVFVQADFTGLKLDEMADLELINLAIEKWRTIRDAYDLAGVVSVRNGTGTCALCQVYRDDDDGDCARCPIKRYTGWQGCCETPYMDWALNPCPKTADAEIAFLEELKAHLEQQKGENDE